MVSFTGSTATGRRFLRYAADSNLKRVVLECGGKNPAVVLGDAEDLVELADRRNGRFTDAHRADFLRLDQYHVEQAVELL